MSDVSEKNEDGGGGDAGSGVGDENKNMVK